MDESDESNFVAVNSGTVPAVFGVKSALSLTYTGSASAVIVFGYYIITWLVQFRGLVDGNTQIARPVVAERKEASQSVSEGSRVAAAAAPSTDEPHVPDGFMLVRRPSVAIRGDAPKPPK